MIKYNSANEPNENVIQNNLVFSLINCLESFSTLIYMVFHCSVLSGCVENIYSTRNPVKFNCHLFFFRFTHNEVNKTIQIGFSLFNLDMCGLRDFFMVFSYIWLCGNGLEWNALIKPINYVTYLFKIRMKCYC